jgi:phosphoribosylamine---glycine ligase
MGAYAPVPEANAYKEQIEKTIIEPILRGIKEEGCPFEGILYVGLMITREGPKVIEFNCRFGDPEAQTILPLMETDLVDVCQAIVGKTVNTLNIKWSAKSAVCVYVVSKDYPKSSSEQMPITFSAHMESNAYYGAVALLNNELVTNGGRVLSVTSVGLSKAEAQNKVYHDLNKVFFEGMHFRKDIGQRDNTLY